MPRHFSLQGSPRGRSDRQRKGERSTSRRLSVEYLEERNLLSLQGNVLFPADNPWNQVIAAAPVAANSATLVSSIGAGAHLHPDFGTIYQGAYIGIPFNVVSGSQPLVEVIIDAYPDESDLIGVPIPAGAVIEGDPLSSSQNTGDRHLIVYDEDNNVAYELFNVHRPSETADGKWHADSLAFWDMNQNWFRTPGHTSADAAGLPILPGLVRPDEVLDQGVINHALRFTVPRSRNQYVYPASHQAGQNNASYPRMGERFRLKADFDISGFSPTNQVILQALKEYGMIVADNGSGWYLSGEPSWRWDDDDLHDLTDILGSNFEAVDLRPIVTDVYPDSGPVTGSTSVTIVGQNFSGAAGQLQVLFGAAAATNVTVLSDTMIVATTPAHAPGNVQVRVVTPYGTSATSAGGQFTFSTEATVAGRYVFYNQSAWDGGSAAISPVNDSAAIAPDKSAYMPNGTTANFNSVTSYSRGINGIMVDLAQPVGTITAGDFVFKVGNNNAPNAWAAAPAPSGFLVVSEGGVGGTDRVIITWQAGVIRNQWLEVRVLANANTGLSADDVHFWGNKVGDSGTATPAESFTTTSIDALQVYSSLGAGKPITELRDFNRDGSVTSIDALQVFAGMGSIVRLNLAADGPFAPVTIPAVIDRDDSKSAVASGLTSRWKNTVAEASPMSESATRHPLPGGRSRHQIQAALAADRQFAAMAAAGDIWEEVDFDFEEDGHEPNPWRAMGHDLEPVSVSSVRLPPQIPSASGGRGRR